MLAGPPGAELGTGDEPLDAAISPDERRIAFVATSNGTLRLWLKAVDADGAEPLPGTEGAQLPAWKQTGQVIAFFAGGMLKQISIADRVVRDLVEMPSPAGATWLPDGSLLLASAQGGPIRRLRNGTLLNATKLAARDRNHIFPAAADSVGAFVYTAVGDDGRHRVRLVMGDQERELTTTSGHAQLVGDRLLHVRDNALVAQRFDRESGTLAAAGNPLAVDVGLASSGRALFTASSRLLLSATATPRARAATWFDVNGQRLTTTGDVGDYWQVRDSPDDRDVAITVLDPLLRTLDVDVIPASGDVERMSRSLTADTDPVWSPDGRRVLFRSLQEGRANLFTRRVHDRGADVEPLFRSDRDKTPTDWRGSDVLFHAPAATLDIWALDTSTNQTRQIVDAGFNETDGRWSPDRRSIAYVSDESGRSDVYVARVSDGVRVRVSFGGGTRPRWNGDGRALFFLRGTQIMRSDLLEGALPRFTPARLVFDAPGIRDFDVSSRTDRILALVPVQTSVASLVSVLVDWRSLAP